MVSPTRRRSNIWDRLDRRIHSFWHFIPFDLKFHAASFCKTVASKIDPQNALWAVQYCRMCIWAFFVTRESRMQARITKSSLWGGLPQGLSWQNFFYWIFPNFWMQRTFQHWIATKWLAIDQDNPRMKFSAFNVDCSSSSSNSLGSRRPAQAGVKDSYPLKKWLFYRNYLV